MGASENRVADHVIAGCNGESILRPLVSQEMIAAGLNAWGEESSFWGPPEVDGAPVVVAIFRAMTAANFAGSAEDAKSQF